MKPSNILLVGDHNLGPSGAEILRRHFGDALTVVLWQKGDREGKKECHETMRGKDWDLVVLFYCDLLLKELDLVHMKQVVNIHPASPKYPGVGYDTMPLIHGRSRHYATLHWVTDESVDQGPIIQVLRRPIPAGSNYSWLRKANQQLCLEQLAGLATLIDQAESLDALAATLNQMVTTTNQKWEKPHISQEVLHQELWDMWQANSNHPVFQGNIRWQGYVEELQAEKKVS